MRTPYNLILSWYFFRALSRLIVVTVFFCLSPPHELNELNWFTTLKTVRLDHLIVNFILFQVYFDVKPTPMDELFGVYLCTTMIHVDRKSGALLSLHFTGFANADLLVNATDYLDACITTISLIKRFAKLNKFCYKATHLNYLQKLSHFSNLKSQANKCDENVIQSVEMKILRSNNNLIECTNSSLTIVNIQRTKIKFAAFASLMLCRRGYFRNLQRKSNIRFIMKFYKLKM